MEGKKGIANLRLKPHLRKLNFSQKMDIINDNAGIVTHWEANKIIKEYYDETSEQSDPLFRFSGLTGIEKLTQDNVLGEFESSHVTQDEYRKVIDELQQFELTNYERATLINIRPKSAVDLFMIIGDDLNERFTKKQQRQLLHVLRLTQSYALVNGESRQLYANPDGTVPETLEFVPDENENDEAAREKAEEEDLIDEVEQAPESNLPDDD